MTTTEAPPPKRRAARVDAHVVAEWRTALAASEGSGSSAADVDLLAALEALKSTVCAVQARVTVALDADERDRQAIAGVPTRRRGTGVAAQVALARRESPHRGASLLGAAKVWTTEMPHTFEALFAGHLSEYRAMLLVTETACLELEDRREVDRLLCADPSTLDGVSTRRLVALARSHAARIDPASVARRARRAEGERCVSLRPAPDSMTYLTALLPMKQGVAVYAALRTASDLARTQPGGDPRGPGQVMADTLVERITGQASADAVPISVNLVVSDETLLGSGHEPAFVPEAGPVPASIARAMVASGIDASAAWLRRLYTDPGGRLVGMTSRDRFHPDGLAAFLRIRDQGICRTPYCDAPIRHIDHVTPVSAGGATDADNGQGLCEACNYAKQAPGWRQATRAGPAVGRHVVETTTPTGHTYVSRAPAAPTPARPVPASFEVAASAGLGSVVDIAFAQHARRIMALEYASRAS